VTVAGASLCRNNARAKQSVDVSTVPPCAGDLRDARVSTQPAAGDSYRQVADAVAAAAELAAALGRDDLAQRLRIAVARLTRPATVICVVGEFKQGKSSLVNALLGETVCPVDDDLATSALTLIRYGAQPRVEIRRRVGSDVVVEETSVEQLGDWVCEAGNPGNAKGVERVDVLLPNEALADGLALVDTPGMGSLGAGHAAATLAFLPFADGLVFVSDASSELTAPEVEFLDRARELCPNVLFALTKTDLYGEWRRIAEIDAGHLAPKDPPLQPVAVSAYLRAASLAQGDRALNVQSGFPVLFAALRTQVIDPAKSLAAARAGEEARGVTAQLGTTLHAELDALTSADRGAETVAQATAAVARLEHLRGPGSRWGVLVSDRLTDLANDVNFRFRGAMRQTTRDLEEQIEDLKSAKEWEALTRDLQTSVAEAVTAAFVAIASGAQAIRTDVVELLAEEVGDLPLMTSQGAPVDVRNLWSTKSLDPKGSKGGRALTDTVTGLRGAQSGIVMFGMMARFLPAGVGAILMLNPVMIGFGAAFGGLQLLDAHKRKIAQRRQQARASVRQFTDDVQFEVGNAISEALRGVQREIRDEFTVRTTELQRTYSDSALQATEAAKRGAADAQARAVQVEATLVNVAAVQASIVASLAAGVSA
jgi:GTPase SAR1 family protein